MNKHELNDWLRTIGWTQPVLAEKLGSSLRSLKRFWIKGRGTNGLTMPIPINIQDWLLVLAKATQGGGLPVINGHVEPMQVDELVECLKTIGWSFTALATKLHLNKRKVRSTIATGEELVDRDTAKFLRSLAEFHRQNPLPEGWSRESNVLNRLEQVPMPIELPVYAKSGIRLTH